MQGRMASTIYDKRLAQAAGCLPCCCAYSGLACTAQADWAEYCILLMPRHAGEWGK